ncbi:hypothetical protein QFZ43_000486 [Streptomyces afghaniensis]|nr:hypothetical protein [Streptomyces afghaniensis]
MKRTVVAPDLRGYGPSDNRPTMGAGEPRATAGAHCPFEVLEAAAEVLADGGEGGGDDQVVERGDESGRAGDGHGPDGAAAPTPLLALLFHGVPYFPWKGPGNGCR